MEAKIRIVTGAPALVEHEVSNLLDAYASILWNVQPGPNGALVTCILISEKELRKAQLAAIPRPPGRTA